MYIYEKDIYFSLIQRQIMILFNVMEDFDFFVANELWEIKTLYKHWSVKTKWQGSTTLWVSSKADTIIVISVWDKNLCAINRERHWKKWRSSCKQEEKQQTDRALLIECSKSVTAHCLLVHLAFLEKKGIILLSNKQDHTKEYDNLYNVFHPCKNCSNCWGNNINSGALLLHFFFTKTTEKTRGGNNFRVTGEFSCTFYWGCIYFNWQHTRLQHFVKWTFVYTRRLR